MSHIRNTGKTSEQIFEKYWDSYGKLAYLERRIDLAHVRGLNPDVVGLKFPPQPSDYILTHHGTVQYCEVKSCNNKTSFPLGQIEDGQWAAARRVTAAGGFYWFFIHNKTTDDWYRVPASFVLDWKASKSLPWKDLERFRWLLT